MNNNKHQVYLFLIVQPLVARMPIFGQSLQQMHREVFVVAMENINHQAIVATDEDNRRRYEAYEKKREVLLQEKLIRDRKIELDTQLTIDAARIQNKEPDIEKIERDKATKLQESQKRFEIDIAAALKNATRYEYNPPQEDFRYTITFFDRRFSTRTWYEVFVENKKDAVPFEGSSFEPWMQKTTTIGDGYLLLEMISPMPREGTSRRIKMPIGMHFIIYTLQFE